MKREKLTTSERAKLADNSSLERKKIFKELCRHLEQGFSLRCFGDLSDVTVYKYLKTYPEDFVKEDYEAALRKGQTFWEGLGRKQAIGECLGNSRTWFYNMANRYGWRDKIDLEAEHKGQLQVQVVNYGSQKLSETLERGEES